VDLKTKHLYHSQPTFFGLTDSYIKGVYEQLFFLKQHGNWSFVEAYNLPNQLRQWWVDRLSKYFEEEKKAMERAQKR
jgi:hypothetical protein